MYQNGLSRPLEDILHWPTERQNLDDARTYLAQTIKPTLNRLYAVPYKPVQLTQSGIHIPETSQHFWASGGRNRDISRPHAAITVHTCQHIPAKSTILYRPYQGCWAKIEHPAASEMIVFGVTAYGNTVEDDVIAFWTENQDLSCDPTLMPGWYWGKLRETRDPLVLQLKKEGFDNKCSVWDTIDGPSFIVPKNRRNEEDNAQWIYCAHPTMGDIMFAHETNILAVIL